MNPPPIAIWITLQDVGGGLMVDPWTALDEEEAARLALALDPEPARPWAELAALALGGLAFAAITAVACAGLVGLL